VERQNLSMRVSMRRFTRLTNAFSKKLENHAAAVALYFMWYNFGRVRQTLKTTPAVKVGIADHVWTVEEIIGLLGQASARSPAQVIFAFTVAGVVNFLRLGLGAAQKRRESLGLAPARGGEG
jgi:hypothetical protein